jgi:membrane protease YdiL (CAAX protease family)
MTSGTPDPGSRRAALIAWAVLLLGVITVAALQQIGVAQSQQPQSQQPPSQQAPSQQAQSQQPAPPATQPPGSGIGGSVAGAATDGLAPPGLDPFSMTARLTVKFAHTLREMGAQESQIAPLAAQVTTAAREPVEQLRAAMASDFLSGPQPALEQLDRVDRALAPRPPPASGEAQIAPEPALTGPAADALRADAATLRALLESRPGDVTPDARAALERRHGWFATLALTRDTPADPARLAIIRGGAALLVFLVLVGLGALAIVVAGFVAAGIMTSRLAARRVRPAFDAPAPGGSVYLETAAAFVVAFLLTKVIVGAVAGALGPGREALATNVALLTQWLVLPVVFWPVLRGVPVRQHLRLVGLHRGRGVFREIGAGLVAYLAGIPLLLAAIVITLVAVLLHGLLSQGPGGTPPPPPTNPIFELVGSGGLLTLVLLYALGTLWAPFVEECVFRGALYRHLRARLAVLAAGPLSALAFGVMHGYPWYALTPVMTLGFVFALMREWRDSLIAPIVTHALHNGTVLGIVILLMSMVS